MTPGKSDRRIGGVIWSSLAGGSGLLPAPSLPNMRPPIRQTRELAEIGNALLSERARGRRRSGTSRLGEGNGVSRWTVATPPGWISPDDLSGSLRLSYCFLLRNGKTKKNGRYSTQDGLLYSLSLFSFVSGKADGGRRTADGGRRRRSRSLGLARPDWLGNGWAIS